MLRKHHLLNDKLMLKYKAFVIVIAKNSYYKCYRYYFFINKEADI